MKFINLLALFVLWFAIALPSVAVDVTDKLSDKQLAQMLVSEFPQADPMVLDHARRLIAGEPVKTWKNCLLQKTLDEARAKQSSSLADLK